MEKQGEQGRFQEGACSSQASLGFQQGQGSAGASPLCLLVSSMAELPRPFPGTPSSPSSVPLAFLHPSGCSVPAPGLCAQFWGSQSHCGHGAELPPKVLGVQAKLLLCETRNPPLGTAGFSHPWLEPTLQSGKVQRGQNHFPRRVEFTDLSSPPCVVFSRAAIKNHEYGFNISNWEHLPSPINTLPCQPWPEG